MRTVTPEEIEAAARALITARETNLGIELTMPVVYPNGKLVTVAVTIDSGRYLVHDAGFGAMHLTSAGVQMTRQLAQRLAQLAAQYGCEFVGARMQRHCEPHQIAIAAAMVANASRTVGDRVLEVRHQTENDFRGDVAEKLRAIVGKRVRDNEQVRGKHGRLYRIPHVVLDVKESRPIAFVVALASRNVVLSHFGELWDIKAANPDVANDVIYNDQSDIRSEDQDLLSEVSNVIPPSEIPAHFRQMLAVA